MAKIRLEKWQTSRDRLPDVCMVCGEPASDHVRKNFSWHPPWVIVTIVAGLVIYAVLALVLTKRMAVDMPICDRHRGYWWKRSVLMFLPLLLIAVIGIAVFALADQTGYRDAQGFVCGGTIGVGLVWLIFAAVIQSLAIQPTEITDRAIMLKGVHDEFAEAFSTLRQSQREAFDRLDDEEGEDYD